MTPIPATATLLIVPLSPQPPEGGRVVRLPDWMYANENAAGDIVAISDCCVFPGDVIDGRTVKAVRAPKMIDDVDSVETNLLGFEYRSEFGRDWNARYPQLPADSNPWVWLIELDPTT